MARMLNWNIQRTIPEIAKVSMPVLEECANIIRDEAKAHLWHNAMLLDWNLRGPYKTGKDAGKVYTARDSYLEMLNTIRVVKKGNKFSTLFQGVKNRSIWVMAGNYKTWWALQMEYGKGGWVKGSAKGWRGGARPFFRKAMRTSIPKIKALLAARRIK